MPTVDRPVSEVDKREVEQDVMCPLHHVNFGPQLPRLPLLLIQTSN
jgi:hypothetical protein